MCFKTPWLQCLRRPQSGIDMFPVQSSRACHLEKLLDYRVQHTFYLSDLVSAGNPSKTPATKRMEPTYIHRLHTYSLWESNSLQSINRSTICTGECLGSLLPSALTVSHLHSCPISDANSLAHTPPFLAPESHFLKFLVELGGVVAVNAAVPRG